MAASLIRTVYRGTRSLSSVVKDANRARQIAAVVARHGFAQLLEARRADRAQVDEARAEVLSGGGAEEGRGTDLAGRVVKLIEELGPTFIKFGQILSTRPDLIPPQFIARMQSLQDRVAPIALDTVRQTIVGSLGAAPEDLFARFDDKPIASASIAQVHGARTKDGHEVVVKVQRPGLRPVLEADLSLLRFFVAQVLDIFPEAAVLDLAGMVGEFDSSLMREIDFSIEQQSLANFARNFAGNAAIHIPRAFSELSSSTVLTMERIAGTKLTAIPDAETRLRTARLYLDAAYQMVFKDGLFHGDLHPGNVFLEADGRLGLIDFGMVGRLSRQRREQLIDMLFSVMNEDMEGVARVWYAVCRPGPEVDYAQFENGLVAVLEKHIMGRSVDELNLPAYFTDLGATSARLGAHVPAEFAMLFKAMATTEGLARQLAAGINPIEAARPYITALIRERYSAARLRQVALAEGARLLELTRGVPYKLERIIARLERGELVMRVKHEDRDAQVDRMVRMGNRASVAVISAAAAITGALTLESGPVLWRGYSPLSLIAFAIALVGTVWIALGVLRGR